MIWKDINSILPLKKDILTHLEQFSYPLLSIFQGHSPNFMGNVLIHLFQPLIPIRILSKQILCYTFKAF